MFSVICIIFSLFWLVMGFAFIKDCEEGPGVFVLLLTLAVNLITPISHISDLTYIRHGHKFIEVREQAIKDIDEQLKGFDVSSALVNADTPIKTFIETKAQYVRDITEKKEKLVHSQLSIEARKMSHGAWAVWVWGEK